MRTEKYLNEQVSHKHRGDTSWGDRSNAHTAKKQKHPGKDTGRE